MFKFRFTENSKGYVAATLAAISFGSSGLFVKLAQQTGLNSINLLIVQHLVAAPILWIIAVIKYKDNIKISKKNLIKFLILGTCLSSVMNALYYESFEYLDISIATIIFYTYPAILAVLSIIFLKQRLSIITILSLVMAFSGCILVLDLLNNSINMSMIGILYGFGAAIVYAVYSMVIEGVDKEIPPMIFITYITTFALLGLFLLRPPVDLIKTSLTGTQIGIAAALAFICQIPPNTLLYMAVKAIGAVKTSIVSNVEIPSAVIFGYLFFDEVLNFYQIMGMLLVVAGIILMKNGDIFLLKWRHKNKLKLKN